MKVYAIEEGNYSSYHVIGVFSTRENAERVVEAIEYGSQDIKEWKLDPTIKEMNAGLSPFSVRMDCFGQTESCEHGDYPIYGARLSVWKKTDAPAFKKIENISDMVTGTVWAKDKQHAIKIANEYRSAQIAQNLMTFRGEQPTN